MIEIDCSSHNDQEEYDGKRENFTESLNLKMCRISDFRIRHDLANVMKELENYIVEYFSLSNLTPRLWHPFFKKRGIEKEIEVN